MVIEIVKLYLSNTKFTALLLVLLATRLLPLQAQQPKLGIHGYLSQAFATSDNHQVFGIPTDGTFDYRIIALQFRYEMDSKNNVAIQFEHYRLGKSPLQALNQDVRLDWAVYEHRFSNRFSLKVGKVLLPFGIFNEIREVGVLLPTYRPPVAMYSDEDYFAQTINGLVAEYQLPPIIPGDVEAKVFIGQSDYQEWLIIHDPLTGEQHSIVGQGKLRNSHGLSFRWISESSATEAGGGYYGGILDGGVSFSEDIPGRSGAEGVGALNIFFSSAAEKFWFRGETFIARTYETGTDIWNSYLQTGVILANKLGLIGQFDYQSISLPKGLQAVRGQISDNKNVQLTKDFSAALNYKFRYDVHLKFEYHWYHGFKIEDMALNTFFDSPVFTRFLIASISASF